MTPRRSTSPPEGEEGLFTAGGVKFAPFRSVEQFLLNTNQYKAPSFKDMKKWNDKIVTNLLFFQTNYLALFGVLFLLAGSANSAHMASGMVALGVAGLASFTWITQHPPIVELRSSNPKLMVGWVLVASFLCFSLLGSVLAVVFSALFPLFIILVHASFRCRSFGAKVNYQLERNRFKSTAMAQMLEAIGVEFNSNVVGGE